VAAFSLQGILGATCELRKEGKHSGYKQNGRSKELARVVSAALFALLLLGLLALLLSARPARADSGPINGSIINTTCGYSTVDQCINSCKGGVTYGGKYYPTTLSIGILTQGIAYTCSYWTVTWNTAGWGGYYLILGNSPLPTCASGSTFNTSTGMCEGGAKNDGICIPCLMKALGQALAGLFHGDPINAGTGNKIQTETDFVGTGAYPLRAERSYNADPAAGASAWGVQWRGYYDRGVVGGGALTRAGGQQYTYVQINNAWTTGADVIGRLNEFTDSTGASTGWTYVNEHDETEAYDATGKLLSITNRAGLTQTLTYSDGTTGPNGGYVLDANGNPTATALPAGLLIRVADPAGRTLQYGYDASSRVVKMTDPAGGVYLYTYDANNNLTSVAYPDGKTRSYLYAEAADVSSTPNAGVSYVHSLTGLIDETGNRYATWTYDAAGHAASSENGASGSGIDKVSIAYGTPDASGNVTNSITDTRGVTRSYSFVNVHGIIKPSTITGQPCDGCSPAFGFDANGNVASVSDFKGVTTCYLYDQTRNLETVRLEGLAPQPGTNTPTACPSNLSTYTPAAGSVERKISTQWNATWRLPTAVAEPLRITSYTYDAQGNLLTRTIQPTNDATGGQGFSAAASGTPRTWTYTYNTAGQVLTVDGPRTDVNDVTTYAYDGQGNLITVTNALNQTATLGAYDANGRVGTITDPNGLVTSLTYDPRGRLTSRSAGGEVTSYTYDGAGNLTNVSLPSGASYTYTYDAAHRLTQIADSQGNRIVYTLDLAGNRTSEQVYNSVGTVVQTHSRVFDTLNHLVQDIGAVNQTTTYTYDADGNLLTVTDPLNRLTTNVYDALNRLGQVTNPDNGVIKYAYDEQDQLVSVTDPRNLVTQYTRDGLGNLSQQQSPDTGATSLTHDAAGNVLTRTDAKGQVATYTYDALNRVTGVTFSASGATPITIAYQYDQGVNGIGRLTQVTDATGVTSLAYDQHGRLTAQTEQAYGASYTTAYAYDAQGRLSAMAYPSGRVIAYSFDAQGRISQMTDFEGSATVILASSVTYEPFGGVHSFNFGDGVTAPVQSYTRNRDQDGRIASYTLNGGSRTLSILYDAASQISTVSDSQNPTNPANYAYDPMSRLNSYLQGATSQGYSYDTDGNRVSQTLGSTTTSYTYGASSNWLNSTLTGATQANYTHDVNGATTSDATKQYAYDLKGRLIQTTTAQGVVNYEINGFGLRVRKQVPYASTDTEYHYDAAGHLISEGATGTATFSREYVWLGDIPVAVLQ
jgi:YD repeat-containing protein